MKRLLIALTAALAFSAQAQMQHFESGNKLLDAMNGSSMDQMYAMGYVVGASDAMNNAVFCLPRAATVGQIHDMVKNYLTNVPADRHYSADSIIAKIFGTAFPCKKGGGV